MNNSQSMNFKLSMRIVSLFLSFLFFISCDESSVSIYTASDEDLSSEIIDSLVVTVEKNGGQLRLDGNLKLIEGECTIYLETPEGDTIFTENYAATNTFTINERFDREVGDWLLRYCIEKLDDVSPDGSFEFNLTYED